MSLRGTAGTDRSEEIVALYVERFFPLVCRVRVTNGVCRLWAIALYSAVSSCFLLRRRRLIVRMVSWAAMCPDVGSKSPE